MNVVFSIRIGLLCVLLTAMGCATAVVTPLPPNVHRIAVLPPYRILARPRLPGVLAVISRFRLE